jgi:hypothetical protein
MIQPEVQLTASASQLMPTKELSSRKENCDGDTLKDIHFRE